MRTLILIPLLILISISSNSQTLILADNGKSEFQIITEGDSGTINVAKLFNQYFNESTGADIPFWNHKSEAKHTILFRLLKKEDKDWNALTKDGFTINTTATDLGFYGQTNQGIENAVYTFFEYYASCRCYSKNALVIPKQKRLEIPQINLTENPSFEFRVLYSLSAFYNPFNSWQKLNNGRMENNSTSFNISNQWGLWVHTMHKLVPPEKYFETHPEYYALRSGVRNIDQMCLSNPEVLNITITSLKELMAQKPNAKYWSVSQMDNYSNCQCPKCHAIDSIEGSPSGSIIRFANQVAAVFPDKVISTLAYQYSRKPPKVTKPASNVNIMLCTIECDRSKPIASDTSKGSFSSDIKGWSKISDNILVWDYVVNFNNSIMPFPNFQVLQPNLKFFKDNHATMMFEQGFRTENTDFTDLRGYLLAKLMWNVNLNTDSLMNDFIKGYYSAAAPYIRSYIDIMTAELNKSGKQLAIYGPSSNYKANYLSPQMLDKYFALFDKALLAAGNDTILKIRVENALQGVRYAWLEVCQMMPRTPNWIFEQKPDSSYQVKEQARKILSDLIVHAKKYGPVIFHERGISPSEYEKSMLEYFNKGVSTSFSKVKSINYSTPYSPSYSADGPNTLIDGVFGTENYYSLWLGWWGKDVEANLELKETQLVKEIKLNCLDNSQSWILAPSEITISYSTDGKDYKQVGYYKNPKAGEKLEKQVIPFTISLNNGKGVDAKYIKVQCKNPGKMPEWSGVVNGDSWIFLDEIEIN